MEEPLTISVITPSYNQAQFLPDCLKSVANQSYPAIEHLVFDPGSTDGSQGVVRRYPHAILIEEPDRGLGHAVSKGMLRARGDIIAWINSDDYYADSDVFAAVATRFEQPNRPDIVYGLGKYVDREGSTLREAYINQKPPTLRERLAHEVGILQPALFFRSTVVEEIGLIAEDLSFAVDYEYWVRAALAGMKFAFLDRELAHGRYYQETKTMGSRGESLRETCDTAKKHYGYLHVTWARRYAEFNIEGFDGILKNSASTPGTAAVPTLDAEVCRLLELYNGDRETIDLLQQNDGSGPRFETLEAMRKYDILDGIPSKTLIQTPPSASSSSPTIPDSESFPLVSVIIPCYNNEQYVGEAIESVLAQDWPNLEIIVVDDGSTDRSADVIQSYNDPRITYVRQWNGGSSSARNTGIRCSKGGYLRFLDADDIFWPDALRIQAEFLGDHPEFGLVAGNYARLDIDGQTLHEYGNASTIIKPTDVLIANRFLMQSTLVRRDYVMQVNGFDEDLTSVEDWDFHCRLTIAGCRMFRIQDITCGYRYSPGTKSMDAEKIAQDTLAVVRKTFETTNLPPDLATVRDKAFGYSTMKSAVFHYVAGKNDSGSEYLGRALRYDPELAADAYGDFFGLLRHWVQHTNSRSWSSVLNDVLSTLPPEANDMPSTLTPSMEYHAQIDNGATAITVSDQATGHDGSSEASPQDGTGRLFNRQATDAIEILPVALLTDSRQLVEEFRELAGSLTIGLGWHYLLDLAWSAQRLGQISPKMRILDAGAGTGVMQWWLARQKAHVFSVDRTPRTIHSVGIRHHLDSLVIEGLRPEDLPSEDSNGQTRVVTKEGAHAGAVYVYNNDLDAMPDIPSNSIDKIVSISSLEHNHPDELPLVVEELMRVLKPGGCLVATLGSGKDSDWFHQPSKGWCYTEETLRTAFDIPSEVPSNYDRYDELMEDLKNCAELRDNLASFYFKSGDNGMPWGKWNPQYQSVGVVKVKR